VDLERLVHLTCETVHRTTKVEGCVYRRHLLFLRIASPVDVDITAFVGGTVVLLLSRM